VTLALAPLVHAQTFPSHSVDVVLDFTPATSFSRWVGGFLPKYSRAIDGAKPAVWMIDKDGATIIPRTEIHLPDANHLEIRTVTADASGNLYASVEVWSEDYRKTGAVCEVMREKKPMLVIRTGDFVAKALAVSPAGEIWAFGIPLPLETARTSTSDYQTLWRFDRNGNLTDKLLPRSDFGPDVIPTHGWGDIGSPQIWATETRIGIFSATASRWIEYDAKTAKKLVDVPITRPVAEDGATTAAGELAMTSSGNRVFAFLVYRYADSSHVNGLYELDKNSGKWIALRRPSGEFNGLYGADGDDLILRAGTKTFGWFSARDLRPQ
jgi:hypothetical protein